MPDDVRLLQQGQQKSAEELAAILRQHAERLPEPERAEAFGAPFDRFGGARVVLLGEATHGTAEVDRARAAITRQLIGVHGFNIVPLEADWPDAACIDRSARDLAPAHAARPAFQCLQTCLL